MLPDIHSYLLTHADPQYREFHRKLVPGIHDFLGVRTPKIRDLAREILRSGGETAETFLDTADFSTYESTVLYGLVAGGLRRPLAAMKKYITLYVRRIDNWALCDIFCAALKIARREPEAMWKFLTPYARSSQEFPRRFALVMYLGYFLNETYIAPVLDAYQAAAAHPAYNVKMAAAWGLSMAFVKFPDLTLPLFRADKLESWTHNKALQKIRESRQVSAEDKELARSLRRPPQRSGKEFDFPGGGYLRS